jgi:hypothetical protein
MDGYTFAPICPFCEYEYGPVHELYIQTPEGGTDVECQKCGERYNVERYVVFMYSTSRPGESVGEPEPNPTA